MESRKLVPTVPPPPAQRSQSALQPWVMGPLLPLHGLVEQPRAAGSKTDDLTPIMIFKLFLFFFKFSASLLSADKRGIPFSDNRLRRRVVITVEHIRDDTEPAVQVVSSGRTGKHVMRLRCHYIISAALLLWCCSSSSSVGGSRSACKTGVLISLILIDTVTVLGWHQRFYTTAEFRHKRSLSTPPLQGS